MVRISSLSFWARSIRRWLASSSASCWAISDWVTSCETRAARAAMLSKASEEEDGGSTLSCSSA